MSQFASDIREMTRIHRVLYLFLTHCIFTALLNTNETKAAVEEMSQNA